MRFLPCLLLLLGVTVVVDADRALLAAKCQEASDCGPAEFCDLETMNCHHKPLKPLSSRDWAAVFAAGLSAMLAAGGGVGGGGVFVPLFILMFQFTPSEAIPLSKAMIFGGAIANFYLNSQRKHPAANRPLVDFNAALMLEPATLAGTIVGVYLNIILPNWLVLLMLLLLLTATTKRTLDKGLKQWQQESAGSSTNKQENREEGNSVEMGKVETKELRAIYDQESQPYPIRKFLIISAVWISIFVLSLIKGGKAPSIIGLEKCSSGYWLAVIAAFPITAAVTWVVGNELREEHQAKTALNYAFLEDDIKWTPRNTQLIPGLSCFAGVAAGCMGIGGGMVKGPLLLELGMDPAVTSATSAFMILFTSSLTTVQFLLLGMLPMDYAIVLFVLGFICTLVGQIVINHIIKKYNKKSLIVLCIAFVIGFSTLLLGYTGYGNVMDDLRSGENLGLNSIC